MQGRVVLVTGAAKGVGKEVARQLAELGATVLVSARNADHARATAEELSLAGDVHPLPAALDVGDDTSVQEAAAALERDPGRLDVLINNAAAYVDWSETASGCRPGHRPAGTGGQPVRSLAAHQRPAAAAATEPAPADRQRLQRRRLPRRRPMRPSQAGRSRHQLRHQQGCPGRLHQRLGRGAGRHAHPGQRRVPGPTATWPGAEAMGARPVNQGAASVLWVATLPDDGPSGELRRDGQPLPW